MSDPSGRYCYGCGNWLICDMVSFFYSHLVNSICYNNSLTFIYSFFCSELFTLIKPPNDSNNSVIIMWINSQSFTNYRCDYFVFTCALVCFDSLITDVIPLFHMWFSSQWFTYFRCDSFISRDSVPSDTPITDMILFSHMWFSSIWFTNYGCDSFISRDSIPSDLFISYVNPLFSHVIQFPVIQSFTLFMWYI